MTDNTLVLREHIAAFDGMLRILKADQDLDAISLFDLEEGTVEHRFWLDRYSNFTKGRRMYADATWRFAMSEEEIRYNRAVAQRALCACLASHNQELASGNQGLTVTPPSRAFDKRRL